jgi:hypothetical protein
VRRCSESGEFDLYGICEAAGEIDLPGGEEIAHISGGSLNAAIERQVDRAICGNTNSAIGDDRV